MSDTEQARKLIAYQAAEIANDLSDKFSNLRRCLNEGTVHHFTKKKDERSGYGMAEFLYTDPYEDCSLVFNADIHKLKSLINAVIALEKIEDKS